MEMPYEGTDGGHVYVDHPKVVWSRRTSGNDWSVYIAPTGIPGETVFEVARGVTREKARELVWKISQTNEKD